MPATRRRPLGLGKCIGCHSPSRPTTVPRSAPRGRPAGQPVWILENKYPKLLGGGMTLANLKKAPTAGADAAQTDTFQFGRVQPGESMQIDWRVTPAMAGTYTVH